MMQLYFVRHGESELNKAGLFAGRTETPLTAIGRQQAAAAGRTTDVSFDCIVSSPQSRALETAQIIASEHNYPIDKIVVSDLFLERDFGELEGQTYTTNPDLTVVPNAEQDDALLVRAQQALDYLQTLDANTVLVVAHGSIGRALRQICIPSSNFADRIPNAQVMQLL